MASSSRSACAIACVQPAAPRSQRRHMQRKAYRSMRTDLAVDDTVRTLTLPGVFRWNITDEMYRAACTWRWRRRRDEPPLVRGEVPAGLCLHECALPLVADMCGHYIVSPYK